VPTDLRELAARATLLAWIDVELAAAERNDHALAMRLLLHDDCRPRLSARLLTLSYTISVFSAEEIVSLCRTDQFFRRLCEAKAPFRHELTAFRKRNRHLLQKLMAGVFLRALKERFDLDGSVLPLELERDLEERAVTRLDIARHMDNAEE